MRKSYPISAWEVCERPLPLDGRRCRAPRHRVALLIAGAFILASPAAVAQELPPQVTPREITARVDIVWEVAVNLAPDGSVQDWGIEGVEGVAHMEYFLTFWNVGELKAGHGVATISKVYEPYAARDASIDLSFRRTVVTGAELTFSGGPEGIFTGTNPETGKPILGHIEPPAGGIPWSAVFTEGIQQRYLIITPEPFAEWPRCTGGGDSGARFSSISRLVEVFPDADPDAVVSGKPSTILNICDHVLTGEESSAVVTFPDLSTIYLRAEAEILIAAPPDTPARPTRLEVLGGRVMMNIRKVLSGEPIEVKTNWATVGIKGTTLVLEVSDAGQVVRVIEGEVEVTSATAGGTVVVLGGEMVTAAAEGLSAVAPFDGAAEARLWEQDFGVAGETDSPTEGGGGSSLLVPLLIGGLALLLVVAGMVGFGRRRGRVSGGDAPPPVAPPPG